MKKFQTESLNRDLYTLKGQNSYGLSLRVADHRDFMVQTKKKLEFKNTKKLLVYLKGKLNEWREIRKYRRKTITL